MNPDCCDSTGAQQISGPEGVGGSGGSGGSGGADAELALRLL